VATAGSWVSSSTFQVATSFCVMQSSLLVRNFKLVGGSSNEPTKLRNIDGLEASGADTFEGMRRFLQAHAGQPLRPRIHRFTAKLIIRQPYAHEALLHSGILPLQPVSSEHVFGWHAQLLHAHPQRKRAP